MSEQAEFPISTISGGRHFFARHEVENYKRKLMGLTPIDRDQAAPIMFVTAQQLQTNCRSTAARWAGASAAAFAARRRYDPPPPRTVSPASQTSAAAQG